MEKVINKNMSAFKLLRDKLNLNQDQMAEQLNITRATLSRWETGKHKPALTIKQIKILNTMLSSVHMSFYDLPDNAFLDIEQLN